MEGETRKLLADLDDLLVQATRERSHYYVASVARRAIAEITRLATPPETAPVVGKHYSASFDGYSVAPAELAEDYNIIATFKPWYNYDELIKRLNSPPPRASDADVTALVEALRWYAGDGSTYDGIDVGQRARAALSRIPGATEGRT